MFSNSSVIVLIITCYLSAPFLIANNSSKVQAVSSLQTSPHPSHLMRPHPRAVGRKVIIISNCRLVPHWREYFLESAGLEVGIRTFILQTHSWGELLPTELPGLTDLPRPM